jgi:hypothetical protein
MGDASLGSSSTAAELGVLTAKAAKSGVWLRRLASASEAEPTELGSNAAASRSLRIDCFCKAVACWLVIACSAPSTAPSACCCAAASTVFGFFDRAVSGGAEEVEADGTELARGGAFTSDGLLRCGSPALSLGLEPTAGVDLRTLGGEGAEGRLFSDEGAAGFPRDTDSSRCCWAASTSNRRTLAGAGVAERPPAPVFATVDGLLLAALRVAPARELAGAGVAERLGEALRSTFPGTGETAPPAATGDRTAVASPGGVAFTLEVNEAWGEALLSSNSSSQPASKASPQPASTSSIGGSDAGAVGDLPVDLPWPLSPMLFL